MDEARRIHKNLQEKNIFIQVDSDEDNDSEDSDEDYESNSYARDN